MKATEQYFHVVLFIMLYKLVHTFKSMDKTLVCDHSNEGYWAVLSYGIGHFAVQCTSRGESLFTIFASLAYSDTAFDRDTEMVELSEYWKGTAWLTVPRNLNPMYWKLFVWHGFKNSKFYKECIHELISTFVTQKFFGFRKPISSWILHPKSQQFH